MSKEFVDAVMSGYNVQAQDAFKSSIADKVGETLEVKRRDYAKAFVSSLPQAVEEDD